MAFLSKINDVSGGDITSIVSSTGLSGGATSGVVTLSVDAAQTGITSLGTQTANFSVENGYGIIIGTTGVQETVSIGDGATDLVPELQVLGTAAADASMLLAAFSTTATTAGSPIIALAKGGHGTLGSHTIVTDGEELGNIIAFGDDGNDLETPAASIQFEVDGTPGANDMPGRILFNTTADGATALSERLRIDSAGLSTFAGNVQLGGGDVDTANAYSALVIEKDDHSRLEFLNPVDKVGTIWFSDTTEGMGRIEYSHSDNSLAIRTNATQHMLLDSTGTLFIGDSLNGSMTQGLTINQGANDNEIIALKSSDVAHLLTGITETDTYGTIQKQDAAGGGLRITAVSDSDATDARPTFLIYTFSADDADTTKSTSGRAINEIWGSQHNDAGTTANVVADGNILAVRARVGGTDSTRWILDEDGDTWQSGGATFGDDITLAADKSLNLPQGANVKFTDPITQDSIDDHDAQGIIMTFTAGMTVTPFSPVYLHTDDEVHECDADAIATMPCIGVSVNTSNVADGAAIEVMLLGLIRDESFTDFGTNGAPVYVSTTVGEMTNTAPSGSSDVVQVIGHSIGEKLLFVQPSLTTVEIA